MIARFAAVSVVLTALAVAPASALGAGEPDLVPELPQSPYNGQVAPVYIDAFEESGRLLYRFESLLRNQGGTLDLYRDTTTGHAIQALWASGEPTEDPDPNEPPTSADATPVDLDGRGASFEYVVEKTHDHWHFFSAARYELELPDGARRVSDKIGFCLFDGFGGAASGSLFFPPDYTGSGTQTWCAFDHPQSTFVRMGLSPGAADRYTSQREFQWVDVGGLRPGSYRLLAIANPNDSIVESDTSNNVLSEQRVVPGVLADSVAVPRARRAPVEIGLSGRVVAPEIPARRAATCTPSPFSQSCYTRAAADGPLDFRIVRGPEHGTVSIAAQSGLGARALYTPNVGHSGPDSFEYVARDARGLESPPALVEVGGVDPPAKPRTRLVRGLVVRRAPARWYAVVRLSANARARGRVERRGHRHRLVRRLAPRRLARGRRLIGLGRLDPGRYRLRLRFTEPGGRSVTVTRRFRSGGRG